MSSPRWHLAATANQRRPTVETPDIHDLPLSRWGVMDPGLAGRVIDVRIVCVHPFGVGVRMSSHDVYGHVNAHHVTDTRFTVEPGRQPTLSIRPSEIPEA